MGNLMKSDFYYGAFLSALLNYGKARPSLFDDTKNKSRRIYKFATEQSDKDHIVFTKYVEGKNLKKHTRWTFAFTDDEITQLDNLNEQYGNVKIALICASKDLNGCELAVISFEQAMKCLGAYIGIKSSYISVLYKKGLHGLCVCGSGVAEDDAYVIARDAINTL